jgi:hypothetical protein
MSETTSGRYDPLPDLSQLPAWVWHRLPSAGKVALAAAPLVIVAAVLALAPGIDGAKDERAHTEAQRAAQARAAHIREVRALQQPRFAAGAPAGVDPAARERLVQATAASVLTDARSRIARPIRRVACQPFPVGTSADPSARYGSYACLAVTRDVPPGARNHAAAIGYPYRLRIDFNSGRYALCQVVGRAGEGMIGTQPLVTLSPSCGGR